MKRSTLRRRRRLRPISKKREAERQRQRELEDAGYRILDVAARDRLLFRRAIHGLRCVVCGRTEGEAYQETGLGHDAHHAVRQEVLKRLHLEALLWEPDLAVPVCITPCHAAHTSRSARIPLGAIPSHTVALCQAAGIYDELVKECA